MPPTRAHALMYIHMMNHRRYLGDAARFKVSRPRVTRCPVKKDAPRAGTPRREFACQLNAHECYCQVGVHVCKKGIIFFPPHFT